MNNVDQIDIDLRLLCGAPIYISRVPVNPVTLWDIATIGYSSYNCFINLIGMTDDSAAGFNIPFIRDSFDLFHYIYATDGSYSDSIRKYCQIVFGKAPVVLDNASSIIFEDFSIDITNYSDIVDVIKLRNCISGSGVESQTDNPADETARQLIKRRNELRNRLKGLKKQSVDCELRLPDFISILSSLSHIPLYEIMKYDIYQLYNQFTRYQMYEQYTTQIQKMLHGALEDDSELKHYLRKIQIEQN